jgi:hypothetical protein
VKGEVEIPLNPPVPVALPPFNPPQSPLYKRGKLEEMGYKRGKLEKEFEKGEE